MRLFGKFVIVGVMICWGMMAGAAQEKKADAGTLGLGMPEQKWGIALRTDGIEIKGSQLSPDARVRRIYGEDRTKGIVLSIFFEPARAAGDSKACRAYFMKTNEGGPFQYEGATLREADGIAFFERNTSVEQAPGVRIRDINAYIAKDGVWVDVHVSGRGDAETTATLKALADSIRIVEPYAPGSMDYFDRGRLAFRAKKYGEAIGHYERALKLEEQTPRLPREMWRVLVDELGMAHGISGDLKKAKAVLEAGTARDPEYPMFYYNLACTAAEAGDPETALAMLRKAFEKKANGNPGEKMPNPKTDASFKKYLTDARFMKVMEEIGR